MTAYRIFFSRADQAFHVIGPDGEVYGPFETRSEARGMVAELTYAEEAVL